MSEPNERVPAIEFYEEIMSAEYERGMSPEEWVARYRHTLHLGGGFEVAYESSELDEWVQAVGSIVFDRSVDIDALRRKHLSLSQRSAVRREERREERHDL